MKGIYLLLGSNLGNSANTIAMAIKSIEEYIGPVLRRSSVYRSAPWGFEDQPDFLNQVVQVKVNMDSRTLLDKIHEIEKALGRKRKGKWHARTIDIDILYFGNEVIDAPDLKVPHPEIPNRRFALVPLCEIAADELHPILKKNQRQLLRECTDQLMVEPLP